MKKKIEDTNKDSISLEECEERIKEIEENTDITGSIVRSEQEETGALILIEVEKKTTKSLIDTGAYLMVMAIEWARYLGIEDKIDRTKKPRETNGITGSGVNFLGRVEIEVQIGCKIVQWHTWIAENIRLPFVIGMDILKNSSMLLKERIWEYEGERIPVMITQGDVKNRGIATNSSKEEGCYARTFSTMDRRRSDHMWNSRKKRKRSRNHRTKNT